MEPKQPGPFVRFLNAVGRLVVGDRRPKRLTHLDVHSLNGYIYVGEYELTPPDAVEVAREILRRVM